MPKLKPKYKLYAFFSACGGIIGWLFGKIANDKYKIASSTAVETLKAESLKANKILGDAKEAYPELKLHFPNPVFNNNSEVIRFATREGAFASGATSYAAEQAGEYAVRAISAGTEPQFAVSSSAAKSTCLGAVGWFFNGRASGPMGAVGVIGTLTGFLCIYLILRRMDRNIKKSYASEAKQLKDIKEENKRLKEENRLLMKEIKRYVLINSHMESVLFIEPREDTPDEYICPITNMIINDPVFIKDDRHAYERSAITQWYKKSSKKTCPLNPGAPLMNPYLLPTDSALQNEIQDHIRQNQSDVAGFGYGTITTS